MPFKVIDFQMYRSVYRLILRQEKVISITTYCLISGFAARAVELKLQRSNFHSSYSCNYRIAGNHGCSSVHTQCTLIINSLDGPATP